MLQQGQDKSREICACTSGAELSLRSLRRPPCHPSMQNSASGPGVGCFPATPACKTQPLVLGWVVFFFFYLTNYSPAL